MTYLQQALAERRAARNAPDDYSVCLTGTVAVLTLHHSAGEAWSFLWSTLVSAWHEPSEGREKIVLTFLQHVVCVKGQNLDRIMAAIGEMRLHTLRERNDGGDHTGHSETGETVVRKLTVERVDDLPITIETRNETEA
jgi:hypothetical protein